MRLFAGIAADQIKEPDWHQVIVSNTDNPAPVWEIHLRLPVRTNFADVMDVVQALNHAEATIDRNRERADVEAALRADDSFTAPTAYVPSDDGPSTA